MANPNPDTLHEELLRIHRAITRGMTVSKERAGAFAREGLPEAMRRGFLDYVRCLVTATRAHHSSEEALAFPLFRERMTGVPFDVLEAQHEALLPALETVEADVAAGERAGADRSWLAALVRSLTRLSELWREHIGLEERHFTDEAMSRVCSRTEQEELGRKMAEHGQKESQPAPLVFPFLYFNLDAQDRTRLAAKVPPVLTQKLIPVDWKDAWAPMRPFLLP